MKKSNQKINCDVYDCCHCNIDCKACSLEEIKISNCNSKENKESTICDSYDKRDK